MSWRTENFMDLVALIHRLPVGQHFSISSDGKRLEMQASNQEKVKTVMAVFPGCIWKKNGRKDLQWWEYDSEHNGVKLHIYACYQAPSTCRAVEEEYETEEKVPVKYEIRRVIKTRTRWICPDDEDLGKD